MAVVTASRSDYYLAYLGRPMDDYIPTTTAVFPFQAPYFYSSPEAERLRPAGFSVETEIQAAYQRLFNRAAEPAGVAYWTQEVASGRLSWDQIAIGILQGAQNDDRAAVANKLATIDAFIAALDNAYEWTHFSGAASADLARAFIQQVGADVASLQAALTGAQAAVAQAVAAGEPPGRTMWLTPSADTINGDVNTTESGGRELASSGDDMFLDWNGNLGPDDVLDGLQGFDRLNVQNRSDLDTAAYHLANIEHVTLQQVSGTADISGVTGLESVMVYGYNDLVLRGLSSTVAVQMITGDDARIRFEFSDRNEVGSQTATLTAETLGPSTVEIPGIETLVLRTWYWSAEAKLVLPALQKLVLETSVNSGVLGSIEAPAGLELAMTGTGSALTLHVPDNVADLDLTLSDSVQLTGDIPVNVRGITSTSSGNLYIGFEAGSTSSFLVDAHAATGAINLSAEGRPGGVRVLAGTGQNIFFGGSGVDSFTFNVGPDSYYFDMADFDASTAAALAARPDVIVNWGVGADFIGDAGVNITVVQYAQAAQAGLAHIDAGFATFDAGDATLVKKITATGAAIDAGATATAGQAAAFLHGGDRYIFVSNGVDGINAGDALIRLVGIQTTTGLGLDSGGIVA
jgi:hypothetical protein